MSEGGIGLENNVDNGIKIPPSAEKPVGRVDLDIKPKGHIESHEEKRRQEEAVEVAVRKALQNMEGEDQMAAGAPENNITILPGIDTAQPAAVNINPDISQYTNPDASSPATKTKGGILRRLGSLPGAKAATLALGVMATSVGGARQAAADVWATLAEKALDIGIDRATKEIDIRTREKQQEIEREAREERRREEEKLRAGEQRQKQILRQNEELNKQSIKFETESREIMREQERIDRMASGRDKERAQERLSSRIDKLEAEKERLLEKQKADQEKLDNKLSTRERLDRLRSDKRDESIGRRADQQSDRANARAKKRAVGAVGDVLEDVIRGK